MMHIIRCIRFGEVLMDENQKFILLCTNCHKDYTTLDEFHKHCYECRGAEQLMASNVEIDFFNDEKYYESKMSKTVKNELKQFRIYSRDTVDVIEKSEPVETEMEISILDLESELSDPRWYTVSEKPAPVKSKSITVAPNSGRKIKPYSFTEDLKTYRVVDKRPVTPKIKVFPNSHRIKRSHDLKDQQQQQQQPKQYIDTSLVLNWQVAKVTSKEAYVSPDDRAREILIKRNQAKLNRPLNKKEPKDITTKHNPQEKNQSQNEVKQSLLINRQTVPTTACTKRLLNGYISCDDTIESDAEIVLVNSTLTHSMDNNNSNSCTVNKISNPKEQNQPNEAQQESLPINCQTTIPTITPNTNNRLSNESRSSCSSVITYAAKKPKLSEPEPTNPHDVPLAIEIPLSEATKPTITSVITKFNPQLNVVNQNPTQSIESHHIEEISNNQIPTQTQTKETEQILNKLQHLGVAIKRTSAATTQPADIPTNNSKALKIIQKLQSNGVKVITMKSSVNTGSNS